MARKRAPTKATGGGGYTFADRVSAGFLVQILRRALPLGADAGPIRSVHFETGESGWIFDDLLLVFQHQQQTTRCAVSIKSNVQLSTAGLDRQVVHDAWEQLRSPQFNPRTDLMLLIVGTLGERAGEQWRQLQQQAAATTPERLVARLDDQQTSRIQRRIFESLRRSSKDHQEDPTDTARLLSRFRVWHFSDDREAEFVRLCADLIRDGSEGEAAKLWSRLLELAATARSTGGYFDYSKLVEALRAAFALRDLPDFESDWSRLDSVVTENVNAVRAVLGVHVHIPRDLTASTIASVVDANVVMAIVGESGTGKSAVLSEILRRNTRRLVWLTAQQLSRASHAEIAYALGLQHSVPELIGHSARRNCLLVLDGFEQFEGQARDRAIELLKTLGEQEFTGWKVVITCQTRSWESIQDLLVAAGITGVNRVDFEAPTLEEILSALPVDLAAVRALLLRPDVQPILRNLVVLDWVIRGEVAKRLAPERPWIGETELIGYIWERWVGADSMRLARDSLLRTLGEHEGQKISGAVHVDSIPSDRLPLLGTLEQEGLVRAIGPSVQFFHDLMGDWARFRALLFSGDQAVQKVRLFAPVPRWGRAIRLYAQSLAEQGGDLESWKRVSAQLAGEESEMQVAQDLFLDGLVFAANSESLLDQVWSDLCAENGLILRRLLKRLLHVASLPDWRVARLGGGRDREQLESWFRMPVPVYWYPALRVFNRHAEDVAKYGPRDGAEVCALWLRTMPIGVPGRREASSVAVAIGREAQARLAEEGYFTEKSRIIFEAVLLAAAEAPEDVAQIALELAARKAEPHHAVHRRRELRTQQAKLRAEWLKRNPDAHRSRPNVLTGIRPRGRMRPQAPDGPARRLSEAFQLAVLDTDALIPLTIANPEVAKEVLLAVCIEEPQEEDPYNRSPFLMDRLGLQDWHHGYPAMYWKGPFLRFLQGNAREALDAVLRLVSYAADRWLEERGGGALQDEQLKRFGLEFEFRGKPVVWVGDANVYGWHRASSLHASTVECALMALEKWLYDEVAAGRSVSGTIDSIIEKSRCLAFAGVLVSLGLRHPELFTRELQPLLGNYYLYRIQLNWAVHEQEETWAIGLENLSQQLLRLAIEWHRMPHRRVLLQELAPWLMLQDQGTASYLAERRKAWSALLEQADEDRHSLEMFLARFDPANYVRSPQPDGRTIVEMKLPPHLEAQSRAAQDEHSIKMTALVLAGRARRLLRNQDILPAGAIADFAAEVRRVAEWRPKDAASFEEQYRINSVAGGLAVLIIQHRQWLAEHSDIESWCMNTLRNLRAVRADDHDSPMSAMEHTAESFLGEVGVALLPESVDEWVVRLAIEGVTGFYYNSTWHAMWVAYSLRDRLGDKFDELVNVVALWSALRRVANREAKHWDDPDVLARYRAAVFRRLAAGRLRGQLASLERMTTLGRRLLERTSRRLMTDAERRVEVGRREWAARRPDDERKRSRDMPDIDVEVLQRGLGFSPAMMREPVGPADTGRVRRCIGELFQLEMNTLELSTPDEGEWEVDGTPYPFDAWVMQQVAEFVAHAESLDEARPFYKRVLRLGPAARYWVETFLQEWVRLGLQVTSDLSRFAAMWRDMAEYAFTLKRWQPRRPGVWNPAEMMSVDLMGIGKQGRGTLGQAKYTGVITAMAATFEQWGTRWLTHATPAAWFSHFLTTESGRALLRQGIRQLAQVVGSFDARDWNERELGDLFSAALAAAWKEFRHEVETDPDLRWAFLTILTELCARQVPEALHLRNRVSAALNVG